MTPRFSIGEAFSFAWNTLKERPGFYIGLTLLTWVVPVAIQSIDVVSRWLFETTGAGQDVKAAAIVSIISLITMFGGWVVGGIINLGWGKIVVKAARGTRPVFQDMFVGWVPLLWYILASFILGIVVGFGFLLLIVPGILLILRLQFFCYAIADKQDSAPKAIERSWHMTKGQMGQLFVFGLVAVLFNIAGVLALLVGALVTVPITMLATGYVYRKLVDSAPVVPVIAPTPSPTPTA